jgi:hypothetical protein
MIIMHQCFLPIHISSIHKLSLFRLIRCIFLFLFFKYNHNSRTSYIKILEKKSVIPYSHVLHLYSCILWLNNTSACDFFFPEIIPNHTIPRISTFLSLMSHLTIGIYSKKSNASNKMHMRIPDHDLSPDALMRQNCLNIPL